MIKCVHIKIVSWSKSLDNEEAHAEIEVQCGRITSTLGMPILAIDAERLERVIQVVREADAKLDP